jgi:hypothetical protein
MTTLCFQQLGIVDRQFSAEKVLARPMLSEYPTRKQIFDSVLTLAAVKHDFDTETGEIPAGHDVRIHELAAITHGRFRPSAVREIWNRKNDDDRETPYQIEFVTDGRLYRFEAKFLGDWYDVMSVLVALNRALADSGRSERFLPLDSGDQTSAILFGDPKQIETAAAEDWIALSDDADEVRREGRLEFESAVREKLSAGVR